MEVKGVEGWDEWEEGYGDSSCFHSYLRWLTKDQQMLETWEAGGGAMDSHVLAGNFPPTGWVGSQR